MISATTASIFLKGVQIKTKTFSDNKEYPQHREFAQNLTIRNPKNLESFYNTGKCQVTV